MSIEKRKCGDCTLCCKVMEVHALNKAQNVWCKHCKKSSGCTIYAERPQACSDFECLWLQGMIPNELKPNRTGAVCMTTTDGRRFLIHIDPARADAHKENRALRDFVQSCVANGLEVIVLCGEKRTLYGKKGEVSWRASV